MDNVIVLDQKIGTGSKNEPLYVVMSTFKMLENYNRMSKRLDYFSINTIAWKLATPPKKSGSEKGKRASYFVFVITRKDVSDQ